MVKEANITLLEQAQKLVQVDRKLTECIEKVEPWLISQKYNNNNNNNHKSTNNNIVSRVRPIPTSMEQVEQVLAISRIFASRTSAPAGWNPNAPLVGFSTPNPLPHQLRGGALAALQLDLAREAEREKKRKRQEEEEAKAAKKLAEGSSKQQEGEPMDVDNNNNNNISPSKAGGTRHSSRREGGGGATQGPGGAPSGAASSGRPRPARPAQQVLATTMDLSDSSSSEDESD